MVRQVSGLVGTIILLVLMLFPIFWMGVIVLTPDRAQFRTPFTWLPKEITLDAFAYVIGNPEAKRCFFNSYIVGLGSSFITTVSAGLAAYAMSRLKSSLNRMLLLYALMTQVFPWVLLVIPLFVIMRELGLFDTYAGLILCYCGFSLPFSLWMLRNYFDTIPQSLDESAMIDGCSRIGAFARVVIPVSLPAVAATAVFAFLLAWNNFLFALVLTRTISSMPVTVWISMQLGEFSTKWGNVMAAGLFQTIPLLVIFVWFQKWILSGLTAGAIKG